MSADFANSAQPVLFRPGTQPVTEFACLGGSGLVLPTSSRSLLPVVPTSALPPPAEASSSSSALGFPLPPFALTLQPFHSLFPAPPPNPLSRVAL